MFQLDFMQNAFMAGFIISILCPFIGLFLVLRRYSMIGDTLSHSSFAGVAIGLVLGVNPLITAFLFTTLCAIIIEFHYISWCNYFYVYTNNGDTCNFIYNDCPCCYCNAIKKRIQNNIIIFNIFWNV